MKAIFQPCASAALTKVHHLGYTYCFMNGEEGGIVLTYFILTGQQDCTG